MTNRYQQKGFTLIEILIVLAILSYLVTFLYSTIVHTATTVRKVEEHIRHQHKARSLFEGIIREVRLIGSSTPPLILSPNATALKSPPLFFKLSTDNLGSSIQFVAPEGGVYMPNRQSGSFMTQITYRLERDPDNSENNLLIRDEMPIIYPPKKAFDKLLTFPINRQVKSFNVRVYNTAQKSWSNTWDSTASPSPDPQSPKSRTSTKVPYLIEISITFKTSNGQDRSYTTIIATSDQ
jgi:prepilin-type N-terminal cleavage/methylation domain-containing protein